MAMPWRATVNSTANDPLVNVSLYRGRDPLPTDASGNGFLPGAQRIDARWGKEFIRRFRGKIVEGVLITESIDTVLPAMGPFEDTTIQVIRDMRLSLRSGDRQAEGLLAGYTDVKRFYYQLISASSTHILSYGHLSAPSLYRALHRLADAYPDPKTGGNTAISSAMKVKFSQVFIEPPALADNASKAAEFPTTTRE